MANLRSDKFGVAIFWTAFIFFIGFFLVLFISLPESLAAIAIFGVFFFILNKVVTALERISQRPPGLGPTGSKPISPTTAKFSPSSLRQLIAKSEQEERIMRLQRISGLYLNVNPPVGIVDTLLNPLLPHIARECFYGDLAERYECEILPMCIEQLGQTQGYLSARRWFRKTILLSVSNLLVYRIQTLLFTESSWRPPSFKLKLGDRKKGGA